VLPSSAVDHGFEPRSGKLKDYKIGICCFSAKHTVKNVGAILINVGPILTRPILQRGDLTRYDRHSCLDLDCQCWSYKNSLQIIHYRPWTLVSCNGPWDSVCGECYKLQTSMSVSNQYTGHRHLSLQKNVKNVPISYRDKCLWYITLNS
jgi:hypothetical protein